MQYCDFIIRGHFQTTFADLNVDGFQGESETAFPSQVNVDTSSGTKVQSKLLATIP